MKRGVEVEKKIQITKKQPRKGDDGHKVVSVRMKDETIEKLDALSDKTNRSRNELINLLLEAAIDLVEIEETYGCPGAYAPGHFLVKLV